MTMARPPRRTQRGQALILIFLGTLLLGGAMGGAHGLFGGKQRQEIRKRLESMVPDPVRREALDFTLQAMAQEEQHHAAERSGFEKDTFDALARHDTPPAAFDALFARADAANAASNRTVLDLRFQLRGQLTDAQWRAVFAPN
jgi:hypothetical protein